MMTVNQKFLVHDIRHRFNFDTIAYILILLFSFLILSPIILPRVWPRVHDVDRYIVLLDHFRDAVFHGIPYPRWLPDMYGGYGYPTFLFYQPGFFFYSLPFSILPGYPLYTMYLTLVSLLFLGGIGAYKLCHEISDSITSLFCSFMFLLTPYIYVNLYVRGDLSELMGMLLCPWPIYFLLHLKNQLINQKNPCWPMTGMMLTLAWVIMSHPATALFFFPVFCIIAGFITFDLDKKKLNFLVKSAIPVMMSLVISSPYWLTVFQMKKYVNLERVSQGYFSAENHLVSVWKLISRSWGFGLSGNGASGSDGMSFQLGLIHFLLATVGFWFFRKKRIVRAAYFLYLCLIIMMTPLTTILWKNIHTIRYIQFPWRLLSVIGILQVVCICGIQIVFQKIKNPWQQAVIFLSLILIFIGWHHHQFNIAKNPITNIDQVLSVHRLTAGKHFHNYAALNEFIPQTARIQPTSEPRNDSPTLITDRPSMVKELKEGSRYRMLYQLKIHSLTTVLFNQLYLPGWKVLVNGETIPRSKLEEQLSDDGRIKFVLPKGEHKVMAYYEGPPGWRVRNIIIGIFILGFIIYCLIDRKHYQS